MFSSRSITAQSPTQAHGEGTAGTSRVEALQQDRQGPFDGELLDLYMAILIVVPVAWLIRSLWS